jgi:hypothetical protein
METYRIRRIADQLFSTGRSAVRGNLTFTKPGKVFATKGALSLHLRMIEDEKTWPYGDGAEKAKSAYYDCQILKQPIDGPSVVIGSVTDYVLALNARTN